MKGSAGLDPVVREGLPGEVALEQRQSEVWGEECSGRRNTMWISPEAGACACVWGKARRVWGLEHSE